MPASAPRSWRFSSRWTSLINTGIAGSLDARIDIGDLVVSTDTVYHDVDAGDLWLSAGTGSQMDTFSFAADPKLIETAVEANKKANPDIRTFTGRIASGDQFIGSGERSQWIADTFHALCVEMEGTAIAQAAYLNKVSFVIIRAISTKPTTAQWRITRCSNRRPLPIVWRW